MTREEFNDTKFSAGMKMEHNITGNVYDIITVDFEEDLIGVRDLDTCSHCGNDIVIAKWLRCENCEIITNN